MAVTYRMKEPRLDSTSPDVKPAKRHPVSCVVDGKEYAGTYWVAGKILVVTSGLGGKSRQVGAEQPETLARQLLGNLALGAVQLNSVKTIIAG